MYMLRCSLFLSPLKGEDGYVRNSMNSVHVAREEKCWQQHKKISRSRLGEIEPGSIAQQR